jgi:hypothetical protein
MPAAYRDFFQAQLSAVVRIVEDAIPCATGWTTKGAKLDPIAYTPSGPQPLYWFDRLMCGSKGLGVELSVGPGSLHLSKIVESAPDHVLTVNDELAGPAGHRFRAATSANLYIGRVLDASVDSPSPVARSVWISGGADWSPDPVTAIRNVSAAAVEAAIAAATTTPPAPTVCPSASPGSDADADQSASTETLEAAIIEALLKSELGSGAKQIVVAGTGGLARASDADIASLAAHTPCLSADAVRNYFDRNAAPSELAPQDHGSWQLVSGDEKTRLFHDRDAWGAIRAKYPQSKGIVDVTRVGFSRDRQQAFVMASQSTGPRGGGGAYFVLQNSAAGWVVMYRAQLWMA